MLICKLAYYDLHSFSTDATEFPAWRSQVDMLLFMANDDQPFLEDITALLAVEGVSSPTSVFSFSNIVCLLSTLVVSVQYTNSNLIQYHRRIPNSDFKFNSKCAEAFSGQPPKKYGRKAINSCIWMPAGLKNSSKFLYYHSHHLKQIQPPKWIRLSRYRIKNSF